MDACVFVNRSDRWPEEVMCATFGAPFVGIDLVYENKWEHRFLYIVRTGCALTAYCQARE